MHELFYFPGAISLVAHIAMLEAGLPYRLCPIDLPSGQHLEPEYRAVHALGRVPALRLPDGQVLSEVSAILSYIDEQLPHPTLPQAGLARARAVQWMSLFASSVHIPFALYVNPRRFSDDEAVHPVLKQDALLRGYDMLRYVDQHLSAAGTVLPHGPSLLDSYALAFFLWGIRANLPVAELSTYKKLAQQQVRRPQVVQALAEEQLDSVVERVLGL